MQNKNHNQCINSKATSMPNRLVFFADKKDDKSTKTKTSDEETTKTPEKVTQFYGKKGLEASMKKHAPQYMDSPDWRLLKERLFRTDTSIELKKRFIADIRKPGDKRKLLRLYKRKAEALQGGGSPFQDLTKLTLKDKGYDQACDDLLIVREKGNDTGTAQFLITAHLEKGDSDGINDSKTFKLLAHKLRTGTPDQKKWIREAVGVDMYSLTPEKLADLMQKITLSTVSEQAQQDDEALVVKGIQEAFQGKGNEAIDGADKEPDLSPEMRQKNREWVETTETLNKHNADYTQEQEGLSAFMKTELQIGISGDDNKIANFLAQKLKVKSIPQGPDAKKKALNDAFLADILNATLEHEDDTGKKEKVFRRRWSNFVEDASKNGITVDMPPAQYQAVTSRLQKLDIINEERKKAKRKFEEIETLFKDIDERRKEGKKQQFTRIGETGIMLPELIDHEGKAIPEKRCNIPILMRDKHGKIVKARISMVRSAAQVDEQVYDEDGNLIEDPKEIRKDLLKDRLPGITGSPIIVIEGVDSKGEDLDNLSYSNFLKEIQRKGLRQDFSAAPNALSAAQAALNEHDKLKSSIKLQRGQSILHTRKVRTEAYKPEDEHDNVARIGPKPEDKVETVNEVITITNDPTDGYVTLDHDITVETLENQERFQVDPDWVKYVSERAGTKIPEEQAREMILANSKASNTDNEHKYRAGQRIPLNEFMNWALRANITEHVDRLSLLNQKLKEDHELEVERHKNSSIGLLPASKAPQIPQAKEGVDGEDAWTVFRARSTGNILCVQQDKADPSRVNICEVAAEPDNSPIDEKSAKERNRKNREKDWHATAAQSMSAGEALRYLRRHDVESLDEATEVARAEKINYSGNATALAAAATKDALGKARKAASSAGIDFSVQTPEKLANKKYALSYQGANKLQSSGMGISDINAANMNPDADIDPNATPIAAQKPEPTEDEAAVQAAIREVEKNEGGSGKKVTPGALPLLHDTDQPVKYHSTSFFTNLWRNTTVLTNNNIWEMGKAMYEYTIRRWDRNEKERFSTVGKNIPWYGTEMDRINQSAETEEVNQFKEAMVDWGVWEIEDELYKTTNRDKVKACLITLAEKGKIRWDDTRLWETLNKITDSKYHIHIPANRDPQVKDPRTGKVGRELISPAIDSLWGEGTYNEWYTQNASKYHSSVKEYDEEGKQLEADPYNNGTVTARLSQLLTMHREGLYVDPQEYEGLIHFIINSGKSDLENKIYFLVQGAAVENHRGQTILTWDRVGSINGEFLNRMPWLDFFVKRNVQRADGRITGWQKADFQKWSQMFDANEHPEHKNKATNNKALWDFAWQTVLNDDKTIVRTNKGLRNAEQMDHDDAHFIIPLANESIVNDILSGPTGSKKYFTYEGYANAFPGYGELIKQRSRMGARSTGLLFDTIKAFVRYDSIMSNRYLRAEGTKYARLDKSYLRRGSVVSGVPTGVHVEQLRNLVRDICHAYGYHDVDTIFEQVPAGEEYEARQKQVETEIARFSDRFEGMVKSDGGQAMMQIIQRHTNSGLLTGLDPSITPEEKNAGMEAAREGAEGSDVLGQF